MSIVLLAMQSMMFGQHRGNYVVKIVAVEGFVPQSNFNGLQNVYSVGTYDGITTYYNWWI